jgi:methylated-DNA-[protein]-cysteine S-methyltransferase
MQQSPMTIFESKIQSPLGKFSIIGNSRKVIGLFFKISELEDWLSQDEYFEGVSLKWNTEDSLNKEVAQQLNKYFAGKIKKFSLPLHLHGTPFQLLVWKALQKIPYGKTCSYQQLAREVGNPRAMRAVGSANGRNPIPIIIPCHRVIRKNGDIGGYSSGVSIKNWLLAHEGVRL